MSVEVKKVDINEDNPDLIAFMNRNINKLMATSTYQWQYRQILDGVIFINAKDKERIICTQSFLPYQLNLNKQGLLSAKSENTFLEPNYRGTSVFTDSYALGMSECSNEGIKMVWGFTSAIKVWKKRLNFEVFDDAIYDSYSYIKTPYLDGSIGRVKNILKYLFYFLRFAHSKLLKIRLSINSKTKKDDYTVVNKLDDNLIISDFFNGMESSEKLIRMNMNSRFLDWRIYKNPNLDYKTFYFLKDGQLKGYYFYSINLSSHCIDLTEFIFKDEEDGKQIIKHLFKEITKEKGVYFIQYFGNNTNSLNKKVFNLLKKYSSTRLIKNDAMGFVLKNNLNEVVAMKDFYINSLWTEGYTR